MNLNFPLILVLAVLITGLISLFDIFFLASKRRKAVEVYQRDAVQPDEKIVKKLKKQPSLVDTCRSIFPVLFIVLVLRSFLFEPFQIPSGSMIPTLKIGDFILVNKFNYGIRLPVLRTKVIPIGEPRSGDVMVFKPPPVIDPNVDYIKRVIGVPGDRISYFNKQLFVNGKPLQRKLIRHSNEEGGYSIYEETLGGHSYKIRVSDMRKAPPYEGEGQWTVPAGHYFMMGDNRDNSYDSRFWGPVPEKNIVGHAVFIWMHWPSWDSVPNFSTFGLIH